MSNKVEIFPILRLKLEQSANCPKHVPVEWVRPLEQMIQVCTGWRFESIRARGGLTPRELMHYAHGWPWNDRLRPSLARVTDDQGIIWLKGWNGETPASYQLEAPLFLEQDEKALWEKYRWDAATLPVTPKAPYLPSAPDERRQGRPLMRHEPNAWSGQPKEPDFTPLPPKPKKKYLPKTHEPDRPTTDEPEPPSNEGTFRYELGSEMVDELKTRFSYHAPRPDQVERYAAIRVMAHELARTISECVPVSEEWSNAIRHLEAAVMFANAGIARREKFPVE